MAANLVAAEAVAVAGFLATVVEGGSRLKSFFAAGDELFGSCAAAGLPVDGAVVTRGAAVLAAKVVEEDLAVAGGGLVGAVAGLDVVRGGLVAAGPAAGLVVFADAAPPALDVAALEAAEAEVLLADTVVLGLAPLFSGAALFGRELLGAAGLGPFVAEAAEVVLEGPAEVLFGSQVGFLMVGLLGTAPAADAFATTVFLPAAAEALLEPFAMREEDVPGRGLDIAAPTGLPLGLTLISAMFGLTSATDLP